MTALRSAAPTAAPTAISTASIAGPCCVRCGDTDGGVDGGGGGDGGVGGDGGCGGECGGGGGHGLSPSQGVVVPWPSSSSQSSGVLKQTVVLVACRVP